MTEAPIDMLRSAGHIDLLGRYAPEGQQPYTFVHFGRAGRLDYLLATESVANKVTGAAVWHINADEPVCLDYNLESNPSELFVPDPYRSSDHDPVLVGLRVE